MGDLRRRKKRSKRWIWWIILVILILALVSETSWYIYTKKRDQQIKRKPVEVECLGDTTGQRLSALYEGKEGSQTLYQIAEQSAEAAKQEEAKKQNEAKLIAIDAGHQIQQNSEKEPLGPGSSEMKAKVSSGTAGIQTGTPEYQVNLDVALKLQKVLEERGYSIFMIRTTNEVDISNAERAEMANNNNAVALVRLHCDGSDNTASSGAMTICMTASSPYCPEIYEQSKALSTDVLNYMCAKTGASANRVWETDTMTGINWSKVPVTIVEMGYLTNPSEEQKLISDEYQTLLAEGIADGIEAFLKGE